MGCKIALVDSGVDLELYEESVVEYVDFYEGKELPFVCDTNGHGTLCCSALLTMNPEAELFIIKVLNRQNKCSSERLLLALKYLLETDVNIINLSLSTDSLEYTDKYRSVISKLLKQGKIILAAVPNNRKFSVLANLNETIGINGKMFLDPSEFWFQKEQKVQCIADSTPYLMKGIKGDYELFGGNSKATALFSGIVSRHWAEINSLSWYDREQAIEKLAKRNIWTKRDLDMEYVLSINEAMRDDTIYKKITQIVRECLGFRNNEISQKHLYEFGITRYNAITLIQKIEEELSLQLDYSKVNLHWFYSVDSLFESVIKEGAKTI